MSISQSKLQVVTQNRKAHYDYFIESTLEVGIVLWGSEVKSLRGGQGSIKEAYASIDGEEALLYNAFIPEYTKASVFSHDPRRTRKLLLHRKEISKLLGLIRRKGKTLIPLRLYFNYKGKLKVELGIASGKKKPDKRQSIKEREWSIQKSRMLKGNF